MCTTNLSPVLTVRDFLASLNFSLVTENFEERSTECIAGFTNLPNDFTLEQLNFTDCKMCGEYEIVNEYLTVWVSELRMYVVTRYNSVH